MRCIPALCILMVLSTHLFAQGPLAPSGPPAPMMKTLDQVESRIPITVISGNYTITNPGSYYLTENLMGQPPVTGLVVNASNVTIDLNGYSLIGSTNTSPNNAPGIAVATDAHNVVICNGGIELWQSGIIGLGTNLTVRNIHCSNNAFDGLRAGKFSQISDCFFNYNLRDGVFVDNNSLVESVVANTNGYGIVVGTNSLVKNCVSGNNVNHGIRLIGQGGRVSDCVANKNNIGISVDGDQCTIVDNTCVGNKSAGIASGNLGVTSYRGCVIDGNHAADNFQRGFLVTGTDNLIVRNIAQDNATDYYISASNMVGTIVSGVTATTIFGSSGGNLDATIGPWSNFAR